MASGVRHKASLRLTDLESAISDELLGAQKAPRFDSPCRIHVHSVRKRLADSDGVSAKAAIDGMERAGILPNDSTEFVKSTTYSQEKGKEEQTIITISTIEVEEI